MSSYIKKDLSDTEIIEGEHAACTETEGFAKKKNGQLTEDQTSWQAHWLIWQNDWVIGKLAWFQWC